MPTAEILSQGDEVVTGQVADTNAAWLATRLTDLGFEVTRHTSVGDRLDDLCAVLAEIAGRADLCIGTGGLGPTQDDLTAEAVARAFDRPLQFDTEAMAQIETRYARFGREMPEVNRKQAWLPTGATRLDNAWGTAPGFYLVCPSETVMAFVPGVPREMQEMFDKRVLPMLRRHFDVSSGRLVTLKTTGVGESNLQERLGDFTYRDVVLSFRTKIPENHVKLRFTAGATDDYVQQVTDDIAARIGSSLFGIDSGSLAEVVGQTLGSRGETVSTAESCTGGRIGAMFTGIAGSSAWFSQGAITYSNDAKVRMLGVDPGVLERQGAVCEAVARQMAIGIRERAGTTYGLSATGIAGPGGGSTEKPVGTVHIAVAFPSPDDVQAASTIHRRLNLGGPSIVDKSSVLYRNRIQTLSAAAVIDSLRRHLQSS